jgi:hypothetical protein
MKKSKDSKQVSQLAKLAKKEIKAQSRIKGGTDTVIEDNLMVIEDDLMM